jgi:hypothetical protein
VRDRWD